MSKLTYRARENLSSGAFVFPGERRYPIHDEAHARNALARASGKSEEAKVRAAVHARYPNIGKEKEAEFTGKHLAALSAAAIMAGTGLGKVKADSHGWENVPKALVSKVTGKSFDPLKENSARAAAKLKYLPERVRLADSPKFLRQIRKTASLTAFSDELEKISGLGELGSRAVKGLEQVGHNVGQTIASFGRPREALKKGWDATFNPQGKPLSLPFKAMMGMSLAAGTASAVKKQDPAGLGHSRLRRVTRLVGDQAGGIIGAPFGLSGGLVGSGIGAAVGDRVGRAADWMRGYKPRPAASPSPSLPPRPQGLNR